MKINLTALVLLKLIVIGVAVIVAVAGFLFIPGTYEKVNASASGPTPGMTGAPGEADCTACHSDFVVNTGTGSISISGVPVTYAPNQSISLTVTTSQADAVIYGFQLTALDSLGRRTGTFTLPPQTPQQLQTQNGIIGTQTRTYIMHTGDGVVPTQFGSKSWTFTWNAPSQAVGPVTFYAAGNSANSDGTSSGDHIYKTQRTALARYAPADFDGDSKTDISIFRPPVGEWWYLRSSNGSIGAFQFGASTDLIAPGDFTGDGKADLAFWRPSLGEWFVLRSEDFSYYAFPFGSDGDIPVQADYDGDGKTDAAVFRPSSAAWYILNSTGGITIQGWGSIGDTPVPADYDGDGKADVAIFRPSNGQWWLSRSTAGLLATTFGDGMDIPVQGDYTDDGKADMAIWRPSTGEWFVVRSEDLSYFAFPFGTNGDVPAPGDYDGDGKFDAGIFRPSDRTWYIQRSTGGTAFVGFGQNGDVPVPGN